MNNPWVSIIIKTKPEKPLTLHHSPMFIVKVSRKIKTRLLYDSQEVRHDSWKHFMVGGTGSFYLYDDKKRGLLRRS
jgi:hypothetical protein